PSPSAAARRPPRCAAWHLTGKQDMLEKQAELIWSASRNRGGTSDATANRTAANPAVGGGRPRGRDHGDAIAHGDAHAVADQRGARGPAGTAVRRRQVRPLPAGARGLLRGRGGGGPQTPARRRG